MVHIGLYTEECGVIQPRATIKGPQDYTQDWKEILDYILAWSLVNITPVTYIRLVYLVWNIIWWIVYYFFFVDHFFWTIYKVYESTCRMLGHSFWKFCPCLSILKLLLATWSWQKVFWNCSKNIDWLALWIDQQPTYSWNWTSSSFY